METEMLPQPEPGIPAPLVNPVAWRSQRWMSRILMLGVASVVAAGFVYDYAVFDRRTRIHTAHSRMISNARQLGMALFEFDSDYGGFPDASTATSVKANTGSTWALGEATSNDLFRQLLVTGIVPSEEVFYFPAAGTHRPDNRFAVEADALARGECGFAYVAGRSTAGSFSRPIAFAPVLPGTTRFDPDACDGMAVVLRLDSSAQSYPIDANGHIRGPDGKDLLDPSQPYWDGVPPEIKWPDLDPAARLPPPPGFWKTLVDAHPGALVSITVALVMWGIASWCLRRSMKPA